jgi:hypothetical protein
MSKNVFANGNEVSGKKDDNQSIAATPDVCLSPPSPPAGPVPLPYPNTAEAADTTDGSKTVKIGGGEVGLKNASSYKKSTGDEAATKSLGMGVVSHNIQGKMKHSAWSMDVKFEGQNAIRHMDMTTHNHMNCGNAVLTVNKANEQNAKIRPLTCDELNNGNKEARDCETRGAFKGGAHTTAYRKPAKGPGKYMKAMCPDMPTAEFADDYQDPVTRKTQPKCKDGKPTSGRGRATSKGRRNDAENKILVPEMQAGGGGMILMSTFHTPGDAAPCYSCRQAICEAEECGIEVWLCKSEKKPPDSFRPKDKGLCPPDAKQGDYDKKWQKQGLGKWPKALQ